MINICMIYYNEVKHLPAFIEAIKKHENKIKDVICIDGPTVGYPYIKDAKSTDGSTKLLKDSGFKVIEQDTIFLNQAHKRNRYLQELSDGDKLIVIDADEELERLDYFEGKSAYALLNFTNGEHVLSPRLMTYVYPMQYVTHTQICLCAKPILNVCFVPGTLNNKVELNHNAIIKNNRPDHNDFHMLEYKSRIRACENIIEKLVRQPL